jgi:hypothetical protein
MLPQKILYDSSKSPMSSGGKLSLSVSNQYWKKQKEMKLYTPIKQLTKRAEKKKKLKGKEKEPSK